MCSGAQPRTHTIRQGRRQRGTGTRCSLHRLFPVSASKSHFTHSTTGLHKTLNAWAERQPSTIGGQFFYPHAAPSKYSHKQDSNTIQHPSDCPKDTLTMSILPPQTQKTTVPFYSPMNFTMKLLTALQPFPHKFAVHSQFCPFHGHFLPLDPSHTPWDQPCPLCPVPVRVTFRKCGRGWRWRGKFLPCCGAHFLTKMTPNAHM